MPPLPSARRRPAPLAAARTAGVAWRRLGRAARWAGALLVVALAAAGRAAQAHPHNTMPPVDIVLTYGQGGLDGLVDVSKYQLASWLPTPPRFVDLEADIPDDVALARVLTRLSVEADGVPLVPVLRHQTDGGGFDPVNQPRLKLVLFYPCARTPKTVRVLWKEFLGIIWENGAQVPFVVQVGSQVDSVTLTPEEPEFIWRERPVAAFRSSPAPLPDPPHGRPLPLPALALAGLALALPFVGPWRRRRPWVRLAPSAGALALAGGAFALGLGSVEAPWGRAQPPSESQARLIFTTLLQGVYRAFDATSEREIYDRLAASVERSLLRDLYGEVYESLVLRETGGGAVCQVEDMTAGDLAVRFPPGGSTMQFDVDAAWTVKGKVSHWGHDHRRENLYKAGVTVRNDGTSWRIAGVEMREHKRVDDGRQR